MIFGGATCSCEPLGWYHIYPPLHYFLCAVNYLFLRVQLSTAEATFVAQIVLSMKMLTLTKLSPLKFNLGYLVYSQPREAEVPLKIINSSLAYRKCLILR